MFCLMCGPYSRIRRTKVEKAMDLALIEQPNMVQRRTLKQLVALEAVMKQGWRTLV